MGDVKTWQERAAAKRRKATVMRAIEYLNAGLAGLPGIRKGTAEKRVRESPQPMTMAKSLVKDWRRRHCGSAIVSPPCPSLERFETPAIERAVLSQVAHAMEMGHAWPMGREAA